MPVELDLPALLEDPGFKSPDRGGVWWPLDGLNKLADALIPEAGSMDVREIKSVPHTWGHVILFETALLDEDHPGHRDAKGQWRALLAMLALRNHRPGFSVTTAYVDLDGSTGVETDTHGFTDVAGREKPKSRRSGVAGKKLNIPWTGSSGVAPR